jgi:histidine triad (HIT) family protein
MTIDCLFCKIINGEIPSTVVYRDEQVTAFNDIQPRAPTHVLILPNKHIDSVNHLEAADEPLIGRLFGVARQLAHEKGFAESGYRLIVNTNADGGQTVFHLHVHLLGGQKMKHPMG